MTVDSTAIPAAASAAEAPARPDRATLLVYFGALIAMFMASLDMQIVVTALPTIAGELGNLHALWHRTLGGRWWTRRHVPRVPRTWNCNRRPGRKGCAQLVRVCTHRPDACPTRSLSR